MVELSWTASLRELGPFFALDELDQRDELEGERSGRPDARWESFGRFVRDPEAVENRIAVVRGSLAAGAHRRSDQVERRVAASVMHLGLVARVLSPLLGSAALGRAIVPSLDDLWWEPLPHSGFALATRRGSLTYEETDRWSEVVREAIAAPLNAAVGGSPIILWGNVASAANGAIAALRTARPDLATRLVPRVTDLVNALPGDTHVGEIGSGTFRRRSCCLIYRVSDPSAAAICGDCVLKTASPQP